MEKINLRQFCFGVLFFMASWFFFSPFDDTHWPKWMMFFYLSSITLGWVGFKYTRRIEVGFLAAAIALSGSYAMADRRAFDQMHLISQIDIMGHAARAMLVFFICSVFSIFFQTHRLIRPLIAVTAINTLLSVFQGYVLGLPNYLSSGFLPNSSMHASMIAIVLPLAIFDFFGSSEAWFRRICAAFILASPLAIIHSESSIGFMAYIVAIAAYGFLLLKHFTGARFAFVFSTVILLVFASFGTYIDPQWSSFTQISRFKLWPAIPDYWLDHGSLWVGVGLGSFRHFGSVIQTATQVEVGHWWLWAHNDWLQILFETGLLGFTSALLVFVAAMWSAYRANLGLFVSLISIGVVSFGNYPLRLAEFAVVVTIILSAALKLPRSRGIRWKNSFFPF